MLRSEATVLKPPPAKPADNEYMVPDSHRPDDNKVKMGEDQCDVIKDNLGQYVKVQIRVPISLFLFELAQLDRELREALILQRDTSDGSTHEEEVIDYEN